MPTKPVNTAGSLLEAAYRDLDLAGGALLSATASPTEAEPAIAAAWLEKGEWLSLAQQIGAEKIFFVRDNPVVVFAASECAASDAWQKIFRDAWCMARPMVLFLATPGELAVYDLTKGPSRSAEPNARDERLIDVAHSAAEIQQKLAKFRRDRIESGRLFEEYHFGDLRADSALVHDIQTIRGHLVAGGLDVTYANALIGRSLFIRYLEDRGVLDKTYFETIAEGTKAWTDLVKSAPANDSLGDKMPLFPEVLSDKDFVYALFDQLAEDFNGDIFPVDANERRDVDSDDLVLLKNLLTGEVEPSLFFFAYKFNVVPIELISNIYEEFLRSKDRGKPSEGSYYTRSSLVEFLLNQTLTEELLNRQPRIIDPAAGSGIFLVESFRRLVRHRVRQLGRAPSADELHEILRDQIAGIDINPEAIRVAAFSLYLAILHYLDPPTIRNNKLPCLVYRPDGVREPERKYFDILVAGNAFEIEKVVVDADVRSRFSSACADVVVGNPPWGTPTGTDILAKESREGARRWCKANQRALGDKELSQAFIHRAMDLLRENGEAALLVSTGVFFKRHKNSQAFRLQWLHEATLQQVVNFAAVRHFFFQRPIQPKAKRVSGALRDGAISPFASVRFRKRAPELDHRFQYWSAKRTAIIESVEAVVLSRTDVHWVSQRDLVQDERLWKVYWWGGHRDAALINRLCLLPTIGSEFDPKGTRLRQGLKVNKKEQQPSPGWLKRLQMLQTHFFQRYGPLPSTAFRSSPSHTNRPRKEWVYTGARMLIGRGIDQAGSCKGTICARFETDDFCYTHSIYSLPLAERTGWEQILVLAVLWSSVARYQLFMTSGSWGPWHNEVLQSDIRGVPFCADVDPSRLGRVEQIVQKLRMLPSVPARSVQTESSKKRPVGKRSQLQSEMFAEEQRPVTADDFGGVSRDDYIRKLERELDDEVFDLFGLHDEERDLIHEMCDLGLDYLYHGRGSKAVEPLDVDRGSCRFGRRVDLAPSAGTGEELGNYIRVFLDLLEPRLEQHNGRLRWRVVLGDSDASMLAIIFSTESADDVQPAPTDDDQAAWTWVLNDLATSCGQQTWAKEIYIDGMLRLVTSHEIAIVKRNERRLWSGTAARVDAEATVAELLLRASNQASHESK